MIKFLVDSGSDYDIKEAEEKGSRAGIFVHLHNNIDMYRSPSGICKLAQKGVTFITVSGYIKNEVLKRFADEYGNIVQDEKPFKRILICDSEIVK